MNTTEMTKTQTISTLIMMEVYKGKSIQEAVDSVLGEGTYIQLAEDVWTQLQPN